MEVVSLEDFSIEIHPPVNGDLTHLPDGVDVGCMYSTKQVKINYISFHSKVDTEKLAAFLEQIKIPVLRIRAKEIEEVIDFLIPVLARRNIAIEEYVHPAMVKLNVNKFVLYDDFKDTDVLKLFSPVGLYCQTGLVLSKLPDHWFETVTSVCFGEIPNADIYVKFVNLKTLRVAKWKKCPLPKSITKLRLSRELEPEDLDAAYEAGVRTIVYQSILFEAEENHKYPDLLIYQKHTSQGTKVLISGKRTVELASLC